jgi:hypothetical protein
MEDKPSSPDTSRTSLAVDSDGNLVKVITPLAGKGEERHEPITGKGIEEAAKITREGQALHSLENPSGDEVPDETTPLEVPDLDIISAEIAKGDTPTSEK